MRPHLKTLITHTELTQMIADGKTLQLISDYIQEKHGFRFSTAGISKRCAAIGLTLPRSGPRSGALHKGWKGGRILNKDGYYEIYSPNHRNPKKHTHYILEHRLVVEAHIGRFLRKGEVVHHKNGNKTDNQIENLELFESNAAHLRATLKGHIPNWTEAGIQNIRGASRKKNGTNYAYSEEELQRRRARVIVSSAIQSELKLGGLPNRKMIDDYLTQRGINYQLAFEMALKHGKSFFDYL